jgi:adenine-specific DNA-methyltransferase
MINKTKKLGQIFTPNWIVEVILDRLNYNDDLILKKYVFEPGCGSGNFLYKIVNRYIDTAKNFGIDNKKISVVFMLYSGILYVSFSS